MTNPRIQSDGELNGYIDFIRINMPYSAKIVTAHIDALTEESKRLKRMVDALVRGLLGTECGHER